MPNWTTNTLMFMGDPQTLDLVREALAPNENGERGFDFNVFLPVPEELRNTVSPLYIVETEDEAEQKNQEYRENAPEWLANENSVRYITKRQRKDLLDKYGSTDWYDWCVNHWGTKWTGSNAQVLQEGERFIMASFDTAWDMPRGILRELERRGLHLVGGAIHEDGNEFDLYGDLGEFELYFKRCEERHVESDSDEDDDEGYVWYSRWIEPIASTSK